MPEVDSLGAYINNAVQSLMFHKLDSTHAYRKKKTGFLRYSISALNYDYS